MCGTFVIKRRISLHGKFSLINMPKGGQNLIIYKYYWFYCLFLVYVPPVIIYWLQGI